MFWYLRDPEHQTRLEESSLAERLSCLEENVLLYRRLSEVDQDRLRNKLGTFIAAKNWEGCDGLTVTDEMKVTVAMQACLLTLGWEEDNFDTVQTILLYPGGYLAPDGYGDSEAVRFGCGEAHYRGPVILSWWYARWDAQRLGKSNLVLHEFAHKLAELGDWTEGRPPLATKDLLDRWQQVVETEYNRLVAAAAYGRPTLLDPYGASNRAEFFAVATECFFLQPVLLCKRHSELYRLLADIYHQEPAEWKALDPKLRAQDNAARQEYRQHAIAECNAALHLRPDWSDAYRRRADCYWSEGQFALAIVDYSAVIRLTQGDEQAEAYCNRGYTYRNMGHYQEAFADYDRALQLLPTYTAAYRQRGVTWAEFGHPERALADLTQAIRLDPNDDASHVERGRVYYQQGTYAKAVRNFSKAIQLYRYWEVPFRERARTYLAMGEFERAIIDCDEALQLNPKCSDAYHTRAEAYAALGDEGQAAADRVRAEELANTGREKATKTESEA